MDAIRSKDGTRVALKHIKTTEHKHEVDIMRFFSQEPIASDPRNHCVRMFDILEVPDEPNNVILVMPFLRPFDNPEFITVGECVSFFAQVFEVSRILRALIR